MVDWQENKIHVLKKQGKVEIYDNRKGTDGRTKGDMMHLTPQETRELIEDLENRLDEFNSSGEE